NHGGRLADHLGSDPHLAPDVFDLGEGHSLARRTLMFAARLGAAGAFENGRNFGFVETAFRHRASKLSCLTIGGQSVGDLTERLFASPGLPRYRKWVANGPSLTDN